MFTPCSDQLRVRQRYEVGPQRRILYGDVGDYTSGSVAAIPEPITTINAAFSTTLGRLVDIAQLLHFIGFNADRHVIGEKVTVR